MSAKEFTIDDLRRILREGAGFEDSDITEAKAGHTPFKELGYESIALLETGSRVEREFDVVLDDSLLVDTRTPRELVDIVNEAIKAGRVN